MGSSLKFADVYFKMTRDSVEVDNIVKVEEKNSNLVESITTEFEEKLRLYNGKPISEEQLKFARDTATVLCNDLVDSDKVVIIPAGAGFGKSVTVKTAIKKIVLSNDAKTGCIIVSDKYKNLEEYENAFDKISYLMDRREEEPIYEQMAKQANYPVVIMTSTMLKLLGENLKDLEKFSYNGVDGKRTMLIIDEKPILLDSEAVDLIFINDILSDIEKMKVRNEQDKEDRATLRKLGDDLRRTVGDIISNYSDKEFYIHRPDITSKMTSNDELFLELCQKLSFECRHKVNHVKRLLVDQGGLFYNKTYNNMNRQFFRTLGVHTYQNIFKTIIFDATADIDLEYNSSDKYIFMKVNKRKNNNVMIYNYNNVSWSKSTLVTNFNKNKHIHSMCKWMNKKFVDGWHNIYITTFKETGIGMKKVLADNKYSLLRDRIIMTNDGKIPTYGSTKGQNNWADCDIAIMFGNYVKTEDIYTAMIISYFCTDIFSKLPIDTLVDVFTYDGKNGYNSKAFNFFRLINIMVDLEQDIYRCAIRNRNSDDMVNIYTFGLNKIGTYYYDDDFEKDMWTDLAGRLQRRIGITVKQIEEVPEEFDKVLNRGDGNTITARVKTFFMKELSNEMISTKDILSKLECTQKQFDKVLTKHQDIKELVQSKRVKRGYYANV